MSSKRPTLKQIAKAAGTSHTTVSLALRNSGTISEATRVSIRELAEKMGYALDPSVGRLMSELRYERGGGRKLALLTRATDTRFRAKPSFRYMCNALGKRAKALGYEIEEFVLDAPGMTGRRMAQILETRGIRGAIVSAVPSPRGHLSMDVSKISTVAMGFSVVAPHLHRVANHHSRSMQLAIRKMRHFGNKRVGVVLLSELDARCDNSWTGGFAIAQLSIPEKDRIPMLLLKDWTFEQFAEWFALHQPDAIVTLTEHLPQWIARLGKRIPEDVQLAILDHREDDPDNAGINQNHSACCEAAVDLLINQMYFNQVGVPDPPRILLIEGNWVDGPTARPRLPNKR